MDNLDNLYVFILELVSKKYSNIGLEQASLFDASANPLQTVPLEKKAVRRAYQAYAQRMKGGEERKDDLFQNQMHDRLENREFISQSRFEILGPVKEVRSWYDEIVLVTHRYPEDLWELLEWVEQEWRTRMIIVNP